MTYYKYVSMLYSKFKKHLIVKVNAYTIFTRDKITNLKFSFSVPAVNATFFIIIVSFLGLSSLVLLLTEAVVRRCSLKKMFLEISQKPQENTCARASFLIKLQPSGLQLY